MRILFMGSGEIGCPTLDALLSSKAHELVGVVSQPDRPKGRALRLTACPAKALADSKKVPLWTPARADDPGFLAELAALQPDVIVLVSYGQMLKRPLLEIPRHGVLNLHPSLLPKYRGAAPIHWAIARGETTTGVTIMLLNEQMDAGDILLQKAEPISPDDTTATLSPRLAKLGARLMLQVLDDLNAGRLSRTPQDDREATFAPRLTRADGCIDWTQPAEVLRNRIRGFFPWPGSFTELPAGSGKHLKILRAAVEDASGEPGVLLDAGGAGPLIAAGHAALRLLEVQPMNRRPMSGASFLAGARLEPGVRAT